MTRTYWKTARRRTGATVLALGLAGLLACSSPEERATQYYQKGMALLEQGDLVRARIELQNALQVRPAMTEAWYALALIAERQGQWDKVYGLLNKVLDRDPKHLRAQVKLGRLLLGAGQLDRALGASTSALEQAPGDAEALGLRAAVLYALEDRDGALEQARATLAIDPDNIDALVVLATERLAAGDAQAAIGYLDRGLRANERNIALQLIKVQALESLAQSDSAEAVLRRLIALYPQTRQLRHALAQFYLDHQHVDAAEAEYRAIAAEHPDELQAQLDLVRFIANARGPQAAQRHLQQLIAGNPPHQRFRFELAELLQSQGDHSGAGAVLREIIAADPNGDALKAKGLLAGLLLDEGQRDEAQQLIGQVLAGDHRNEQGLLLKAGLAIEAGQLDQAIADLRTILRDSPESARALLLLARAHQQTGAVELAQENYLKAYQVGRGDPQFAMAYAEFLLRRGQAARAEMVADALLQQAPGHVDALKLLAQARIDQGNWNGAQAVAEQLQQQAGQRHSAEQIRGAVFAARKDYSASIAAFRRAHDSAPSAVQPMVALVRSYLLAGKPEEASAFLDSVLKASPANATALLLQGELHALRGEQAQAAERFRQLIAVQPKQATGYVNLASLHLRANEQAEAAQVIAQGLTQLPGDFELRMAEAGRLELGGQHEAAIAAYEALLEQQPNSLLVVNNLASLLSEQRLDQASLQKAYALAQRLRHSPLAHFRDTLGWAAHRLGKTEESTALLETVVKQSPDNATFRYHLAMSLLAANKKPEARRELESALALTQGEGPEARRAQAALNTL